MISSAFKGAYQNQVNQQTQGINAISKGVKDVSTLAVGIAGFSGALGTGAIAKGAKHALAGRIGGIGGNIMLASIEDKKASYKTGSNGSNMTPKELDIERQGLSAIQERKTAYETLQNYRQSAIMNKRGEIESSLGNIDPNTELGKKILGGLE